MEMPRPDLMLVGSIMNIYYLKLLSIKDKVNAD